MAYIIERKNRFYVIAYDGIDPATGFDTAALGASRAPRPALQRPPNHRLSQGIRVGAPKTVYDVHVVIRSAFSQAVRQHLVAVNPALGAQPPRSRMRQRSGPECWTADQLAEFLAAAGP